MYVYGETECQELNMLLDNCKLVICVDCGRGILGLKEFLEASAVQKPA